jgi:hypothetical protein
MSNPKTPKEALESILTAQNVSMEEVEREQAFPIISMKYAMIGLLTTMEDFIKSVKIKLQSSAGPLHINNLRFFFTVMVRQVHMAENFLDEYEANQTLVKLKKEEVEKEEKEADAKTEEPHTENQEQSPVPNKTKKSNLN